MVTRVVEDVFQKIEMVYKVIQEVYGELEPKTRLIDTIAAQITFVGRIIFLIVFLLILVYFTPRFWNLANISYQVNVRHRKVPFNQYVDAYEFWYAFSHPSWSKEKREHVAHQTYHKMYHDT